MGFSIRTSKFRHVFCDAPKPEETWTGMRLSTVTGDQQYIKASSKYFVVALQGGGGPMCVGRLDRPGRFDQGTSPVVHGHKGSVLDFDFNPFDDTMFASASEDTTIKVWGIPDEWEPTDDQGLFKAGENLTESLTDLVGHKKKVTLLRYHPTASNILLSTSADSTVKTWDVEKGEAITSIDVPDLTQDIVWDHKGDAYATSCKDKNVRICDARSASVSISIESAHEGRKSTKLAFLGESTKFLTSGASKTSSREIKIWDLKNLSKPLCTETVDTASGALIPLYDQDTNVIYLCGKGDGQIRLFEFEDKAPYLHKLNDGYRTTKPTKGICLLPKRGLNVMKHETARLLKLTNNSGVHPLSFYVPRKSDAFQDDIFPDCAAPSHAHSGDQWFSGSSKNPVTMPLNPALSGGKAVKKKSFKTVSSLSKELDEANKRIQYLETKLTENNIAFD
mmetsp:Transcript_12043/g.17657  ORF Transcript_12043/g.17657 Transcript_12043/m.17657 type:complete len:449 (-) Transcript_12043:315-1661(-)